MEDIVQHVIRLIYAVDEARAEEGGYQCDAVVELRGGACHANLVEEPVEVEKGRGELVEDEDWSIVVHERPLYTLVCDDSERENG